MSGIIQKIDITKNYLLSILEKFGQLQQIKQVLNQQFSYLLTISCNAYSRTITSDDIKEYYISTLAKYQVDNLVSTYKDLFAIINQTLTQLYGLRQDISTQQNYLYSMVQHWRKSNQLNQSLLNNYDLEKFIQIIKYTKKLLELFMFLANYNNLNVDESAADIHKIYWKITSLKDEVSQKSTAALLDPNENHYLGSATNQAQIEEYEPNRKMSSSQSPDFQQPLEAEDNLSYDYKVIDAEGNFRTEHMYTQESQDNQGRLSSLRRNKIQYLKKKFVDQIQFAPLKTQPHFFIKSTKINY